MSDYPLVWWVKKTLPHRHGQRCDRIDWDPATGSRIEPEPWQAAEEGWRLFEFEDGTREWGPKHCARRPDRDWRDELEHASPSCTGEWRRARGHYACPTCEVWVRRTPETTEEFHAALRSEHALHGIVASNRWRAVIEAAEEGTEPLEFVRLLVAASRGLAYDAAFRTAAEECDVLVGRRAACTPTEEDRDDG